MADRPEAIPERTKLKVLQITVYAANSSVNIIITTAEGGVG